MDMKIETKSQILRAFFRRRYLDSLAFASVNISKTGGISMAVASSRMQFSNYPVLHASQAQSIEGGAKRFPK